MIASEIKDLEQYIVSKVGVNCEFTNRDLDPNEYPFIKILLVEQFEVFPQTDKILSTDLPVELRIITEKGNEYKALEVLERLYQKINQFNPHRGNTLRDAVVPEYVEETKTFEIGVPYLLKLMIQDT